MLGTSGGPAPDQHCEVRPRREAKRWQRFGGQIDANPAAQSLRVFRAHPSSALERRPVQAQSAAIAGYGEHLQRRLGVFGRDELA